jgi:hypothetical protein
MRFATRTRTCVVLGTVLAAASVGISAGLAKSGPSQVTVPIQLFNANCGFPTSKKFIGKATFITDKGVLTVRAKIHGGVPGKYDLELWTGDSCDFVAKIDSFKVDGSGDGESAGAIAVKGQRWFITIHDQLTGQYHDSLIAKVGGL